VQYIVVLVTNIILNC